MVRNFGRMSGLASAAAMIALLSACGTQKAADSQPESSMSLLGDGPMDVPMGNMMTGSGPFADGYRFADAPEPLQAAAPMTASYVSSPNSDYRRAPAYDYAPDRPEYYYDDGPAYYDDAPTDNSYGWLALASMLGGVLADSPPDYYFDYDGVEPWVWETGDGYARYAEPLDSGYRYYYYQPGRATPFLVRDPYYSYGYRGDRLAVIYDRDGRVLDGNRAWIQRRAAQVYYVRANRLYEARRDSRRHGVAAPRWAQQQPIFQREQNVWDSARARRASWQGWDRQHDRAVKTHWQSERVARQFASRRFDEWRRTDYRAPAPRLAIEARRDAQIQRAVVQQRQRTQAIAARQNAHVRDAQGQQANLRQPAALRREQRQNPQVRRVEPAERNAAISQRREAVRQQRVTASRSALVRQQTQANVARQAQAKQVKRAVGASETTQRQQVQKRRVEVQQRQAAARVQKVERARQTPARVQQQSQIRQQRDLQKQASVQRQVQRQQQSQARQIQVTRQQQVRAQSQARQQQRVERQQPQMRQQQQQRVERVQANRAAAVQNKSQRQPMRAAFNDRGNDRLQNGDRRQR